MRCSMVIASVGLLSAFGCNDRRMDDGGPSEPPEETPPVAMDLGSAAESEGGVLCQEGLLACNGECVDPSTSNEHCGACNHECRHAWWFGDCTDAACPPAAWCAGAELGLRTCAEVCAHHGQTCVEGPWSFEQPCGGSYSLYFDQFALEHCEDFLGGQVTFQATCHASILWTEEGGLSHTPAQAVSCCCTQEPG